MEMMDGGSHRAMDWCVQIERARWHFDAGTIARTHTSYQRQQRAYYYYLSELAKPTFVRVLTVSSVDC